MSVRERVSEWVKDKMYDKQTPTPIKEMLKKIKESN